MGTADDGTERAEVTALVRGRVACRFALTAEQFADHLLALARATSRDARALLNQASLDDLYLAAACASRDERAWAECVRQHAGFMRQFARRFLQSADADELADRVVADLWEKGKLGRYEGRSSLRTWLGAVVAHAALQTGKVARRLSGDAARERDRLRLQPDVETPDDDHGARLLADIAARAISALPDEQKLLLLLHYEQGLSLDQIAPILRSSKATLSRRLKRLREDVRATIERLASERYRSTGADVRGGVDLGRVELDLSALLAGVGSVKGNGGQSV